MSVKFVFKVCRVCLTPEPAVKLRSMFEGRGVMADWFQIVSGCSLSFDRNKHEVLICPKCSVDVKAAFDLRENIRREEAYYFQSRREEASGYDDDFRREQAVAEISQAETDSHGEVNNASSGPASSSSAGASRKPRPVKGGVTKMESFARATKSTIGGQFKCHTCDKILSCKRYLLKHIEAVHEKINDFACDLCPKK